MSSSSDANRPVDVGTGGEGAQPTAPRDRRPASIAAWMPWLLLPGGVPLVLLEWMPPWAPILGCGWIAALHLARRRVTGAMAVRTAIDLPALALLTSLPAAVLAVSPEVAPLAVPLSRVASLIFAVLLAYAVAGAVSRPKGAWWAAAALMVAALGLAALALVSVDWSADLPRLAPALALLPRLVWSVPHATLRDAGLHPNTIAALQLLALPLAISCGWPVRADRGGPELAAPPFVGRLGRATTLVVVPLLLLTRSRGALGAAVIALALLAWIRRRRAGAPGRGEGARVGILALLALSAVLVWSDVPAALAARGTTVAARAELWRESLELLRGHPDSGIGLNTFPLIYGQKPEYRGAYVYHGYAHAHNTLLQACLDYGVPGFVATVGLYTATAWAAWRAHRRLRGTQLDALAIGLAIGLAAHAIHGMVDAVAIGAKPGFVPWAYVGLLVGIRRYAHHWTPLPGGE